MAEAPRKITIKLKPAGTKIAAPAAVKPAAPAPAPAAPAPTPAPAPAAKPEVAMQEIPLEPIPETPAPTPAPAAEAPLTPIAETPAASEPVAAELAQQAKRQTSRINLPPEMTQPMNAETEAPTIKLKPISTTAKEATENPQAAKSKTARIELDQVLGGIQTNTPLSNTTQKTIKLKRAAPAGAAKPSSSAPIAPAAGANTTSPGTVSEAPTIKLKRPMTLKKDAPAPAPAAKSADADLEPLGDLETLEDLSPLPELTTPAAPVAESTGAKAFTIVAIIATAASIIATLILCGLLQKYAASPDGSTATGNTLHSLPFERLF